MMDSTERFSDRVANYVKYRPHYPSGMIDILVSRLGLAPSWRVADVGSGTGLSSERFLDFGCEVLSVEPNRAMREAAEALLRGRPNFRSVDARAESSSLEAASVDLYVSGQAFHWFDRAAARLEALRILRPPRRAVIMWNDWHAGDSAFLRDYDALLSARCPKRAESDHRGLGPADFDSFFGEGAWELVKLANEQIVDFDGLRGRLLSASYAPKEGEPGYEETMADLASVFAEHSSGGAIEFGYSTCLYVGEIRN